MDHGPQVRQQVAQPRALEARVPGDQDPAAREKAVVHGVLLCVWRLGWRLGYQVFHPAWPLSQSLFRCSVSRRVSMQAQKPGWR